MIVTGVQAGGAKALSAVQVASVDPADVARAAANAIAEREERRPRGGAPQPVVFPRKGVPLDQRPVSHRLKDAAERYESDGGDDRERAVA
jgi:hypothetical protein